MANTVIALKRSDTPFAVPTSLANGEIAINYADGKLFYKNTSGEIVAITSGGGGLGGNYYGAVNANGTFLISDTSGDVLTVKEGENIVIVGDATTDSFTISANLSSAYTIGNAAFSQANAAFDKANNAATNSFTTIAVQGQGNVSANVNDTLTFEAGNNINITTNTITKTVLISSLGLGYTDYGSIAEPLTSAHDYGSL